MQIEVKIDDTCKEPKMIIVTDRMTDEIHQLLKQLSENSPQMIAGFRGDVVTILAQDEIIRIYAETGRVLAVTDSGEYSIRLRLYELEERLERNHFVRISNSEIINLRKVKEFDLSFAGTICVTLTNGTSSYVSRRYVSKIKQVLGI